MADETLRLLEQRFRASGTPADEAAWLHARLRAGKLQRDRARLAALLGHDPARQALDDASLGPPRYPSPEDAPDDPQLVGRFAAAILGRADAVDWSETTTWKAPVIFARAVELLEEQVLDPAAAGLGARIAADQRCVAGWLDGTGDDVHIEEDDREAAELQLRPLLELLDCLSRGDHGGALELAADWYGIGDVVLERDDVLAALRADLAPWLLGHGDPLAERVRARAKR